MFCNEIVTKQKHSIFSVGSEQWSSWFLASDPKIRSDSDFLVSVHQSQHHLLDLSPGQSKVKACNANPKPTQDHHQTGSKLKDCCLNDPAQMTPCHPKCFPSPKQNHKSIRPRWGLFFSLSSRNNCTEFSQKIIDNLGDFNPNVMTLNNYLCFSLV